MIQIITDSTSDLSAQRAAELGVEVLPLSVHFGSETYLDGVDLTKEEFYRRLAQAETLPTTSQINPEAFETAFRRHVKQGRQVLGIFLSSDMSGTCQSAGIARSLVDEDNIAVVDSRTVTFALGLLVERACQLRDRGLTLEELAAELRVLAGRVRLLAAVDTLKYLKMGGRITGAAAVVGGLLGITPIITIENGLVESVGKTRGRKAAFAWMEKWLEKEPMDPELPVAFGYTSDAAVMEECRAAFSGHVAGRQCLVMGIGAVVGTHAGPGAGGLAYFVKE